MDVGANKTLWRMIAKWHQSDIQVILLEWSSNDCDRYVVEWNLFAWGILKPLGTPK